MRESFRRALEGDGTAETQLFQNLFVRFRTIAKCRGYGEDCEDLAQEACMVILTKYRNLAPDTEFEPWALAVLRNVIGNFLQKKRTITKHKSSLEITPDTIAAKKSDPSLRLRLIDCLKQLHRYNRRYHQALRLVHDGYTAEEISLHMGISKANLYTLLNRSRKVLKDCLARKGTRSHG